MESSATAYASELERYLENTENSELPEIDTTEKDLARQADEGWKAILARNKPPRLFLYGEVIALLMRNKEKQPTLIPVSLDLLGHILARWARWYKIAPPFGEISVFPPQRVLKDILIRPNPPLPSLTRIISVPICAANGALQTQLGYQSESLTYYDPPTHFQLPQISEQPSEKEIDQAVEFITGDLLGDFPFVSPSDQTHAVALLLLHFVRNLISGATPLHLIEAPCPGTGKGLLADVSTFPALGKFPSILVEGPDEAEWRKRITAELMTGPSVVLVDNLKGHLSSAALAAVLTTTNWKDRVLGYSKIAGVPNQAVWVATGNNVTTSSEIARRTLPIRLDSGTEKPWLRSGFRHPDLKRWVAENHAELVAAILTIIKGWANAGMPKLDFPRLGTYENWSEVIGGILAFAKIPGFLGNITQFYERSDSESQIWTAFVTAWFDKFKCEPVGASDLFAFATEIDLGNGNERSQRTSLGKALIRMKGRSFAGFIITETKEKQGAKQWQLKPRL